MLNRKSTDLRRLQFRRRICRGLIIALTLLTSMSSQQSYKLTARITLYSAELGGRKKPVYSGYRPSFAFNTTTHYSGEIELIGNSELRQGQSTLANIQLLPASTIRKNLKHNDSFIIAEGNRTVGSGVIEKVEIQEL